MKHLKLKESYRLLFTLIAFAVGAFSFNANAQASYNHTYTEGVTVAAGGDYFLYNIGSGMFYTDGMDYGTHASVDHAGRVVTFAENGNGFTIYSNPFSNNGSDAKAGYLIKNDKGEPYVDGGNDAKVTLVFEPVTVNGYSNAYTLKIDDSNYLYYETKDNLYQGKMGAFLRYGANTNDEKSYWLIIPMSARQAVQDYTYLLRNTDFHHPWELMMWQNTETWTNTAGGLKENACAEMYGKGFDISQTISAEVVNGRYKLYNQAFYNNADANNQSYLYANDAQEAIAILNANGEGTASNMVGASTAFTAGRYVNSVETFVSDGTLKVGLKNATTAGNAWTIMDNFYLEYLGQVVMDYAEEELTLGVGKDMVAGTWYYFDIPVEGEYTLNATTLEDIIYTQDDYTLITTTSADSWSGESQTLTEGRYYVKSSSANNFSINVNNYIYTVGDATCSISEDDYINSLTTVTYTFADEVTNDPNATFAILSSDATATLWNDGSQIATGALSLDGKVLTATFSNLTLDLSSDYTLLLPASVVGFEGQANNNAVSVNFHTGLIADGTYYFKRNGTESYLTRGGNYGTEAVTDKFGISFEVALQTDGAYTLKNVDQSLVDNKNKYLNFSGSTYTDQENAYHWTIASTTDGYFLKTTDGKYMTTAEEPNFHYNYLAVTETESEAIVWTLLSKSEYAASLSNRKDAELAAIATAAGKTATTMATFEDMLGEYYGQTDVTEKINNAELKVNTDGWTAVSYNGQRRKQNDNHEDIIGFNQIPEVWNYIGGAKQTISGLDEGIYKITVKSVWRLADANGANRAGDQANVTAWFYANDNYTQLQSWFVNKPANTAALRNSTDDTYVNTVYAYVAEGEDLTIGIASPSWCGVPWMPFYDWTLTRYEAKATEDEITALNNAITAAEAYTLGFQSGEYAPYNNVEALQALAAAKAIDTEAASGEAVVAATTALTGAPWTANTEEVNAVYWKTDYTDADVASDSYIHPIGWTNTGYNTRIMCDRDATANPGITGKTAVFSKYNTTYGETEGYTMPLKANTYYKISFNYCGWGNNPTTKVVMTCGEATIEVGSFKPETSDGNANADHWYSFEKVFKTGEAGDYVLAFNKVESGQQQIAWCDMQIFSYELHDTNITIGTSGYFATVTEYDTDFNLTEGITAYIITAEGISDNFITYTAIESAPAHTAVIIKGDAEVTYTLHETLNQTDDVSASVYTPGPLAVDESNYGTIYAYNKNGKWGRVKAGVTVPANKGYLVINSTNEGVNELSGYTPDELAEITAINGINAANKAPKAIYNLQGQRVSAPVKGNIYIIDGKKTLVK